MNKEQLVKAIAEKCNITQKDTKEFVDAAIEVVKEELIAGGKVMIPDFMTLKVVEAAERKVKIQFGENKGQTKVVPAKKRIKLTVSPSLKEAVE